MVLYYKNSFVASMISIVGCMLIIMGVADGFQIVPILLGIPFLIGGKLYSNWVADRKAFKKWWKQVKDANLEPRIAESAELAFEIYQKNPEKRTLEKIRTLNPTAAALIEKSLRG